MQLSALCFERGQGGLCLSLNSYRYELLRYQDFAFYYAHFSRDAGGADFVGVALGVFATVEIADAADPAGGNEAGVDGEFGETFLAGVANGVGFRLVVVGVAAGEDLYAVARCADTLVGGCSG